MKLSMLLTAIMVSLFATSVSAETCGKYQEKETGTVLEFQNDGTVREYKNGDLLQSAGLYYLDGSTLGIRNSENALAENYLVSADGKKLSIIDNKWGDKNFDSLQPFSCVTLRELKYLTKPVCDYGKEAECCASGDIGACVQSAAAKEDIAALKRYCAVRPDGCLALMEKYQKAANPPDELFNLYAEKKPLALDQLQELDAACAKHQTPELCQKTLEQLWRANRFMQARDLLGRMCSAKIDENSCPRFQQLSSLKLDNRAEQATAIPCGEFKGTVSSLTGTLDFADKGLLMLGMESKVRARIEDGFIKIRHDKGGDFVFAKIGEDVLLGLDSWNQYEVYRRDALPQKACLPPVVYVEQPLSSGCGMDKNPKECCDKGDTQGCNRLGNMAALKNDWKTATAEYEKVCSKGVRVGCENWIYTVSKTGDDQGVESGLQRLCKNDLQHVACDMLEMDSIQKMVLQFAMEEVMKDIKSPK